MKSEYDFDWRGEFKYPSITSFLLRLVSVRDRNAGLRPFLTGDAMLALPTAGMVFYSDRLHPLTRWLLETTLWSRQRLTTCRPSPTRRPGAQRDNRPPSRLGHPMPTNRTGRRVRVCVIDSGLDARIAVNAWVTDTISLVDDHPERDSYGHGSKVASSMCGWQNDTQRQHGRAEGVELMIAKVYGKSPTDPCIRPELIEIAVSWALERGADIIVTCVGADRCIDNQPTEHSKGIARLLRSRPGARMFASVGLSEDITCEPGIMEPACANGVIPVAAWSLEFQDHPIPAARNDRYAKIVFSGLAQYGKSAYVRHPANGGAPQVVYDQEFKQTSCACALVAATYAHRLSLQSPLVDAETAASAAMVEMIENCWRSSNWDGEYGGYGIPFKPDP